MRHNKFLSIIIFTTVFSCLYVYQQTEIVRLAYAGQKNKAAFGELLDKNNFLRYNLEKSISLVRIGESVSRTASFQMPNNYRLVRFASAKGSHNAFIERSKKESMLSRIFSIKRQAEAQTIP